MNKVFRLTLMFVVGLSLLLVACIPPVTPVPLTVIPVPTTSPTLTPQEEEDAWLKATTTCINKKYPIEVKDWNPDYLNKFRGWISTHDVHDVTKRVSGAINADNDLLGPLIGKPPPIPTLELLGVLYQMHRVSDFWGTLRGRAVLQKVYADPAERSKWGAWCKTPDGKPPLIINYLQIAEPMRPNFVEPPNYLPTECQTKGGKIPVYIGPPYWWFALNFKVVNNQGKLAACTFVDDAHGHVSQLPTPCSIVPDSPERKVVLSISQAQFNGGHIECPVDLGFLVSAAEGASGYVSETVSYTTFWIRASGTIAEGNQAPILVYRPTITDATTPIGMALGYQGPMQIHAYFSSTVPSLFDDTSLGFWSGRPENGLWSNSALTDNLRHESPDRQTGFWGAFVNERQSVLWWGEGDTQKTEIPRTAGAVETNVLFDPQGTIYIGGDPEHGLVLPNGSTLDEVILDPGNGDTR